MNLFELHHDLIAEGDAADWFVVVAEHASHAVHRFEPMLTLSWGLAVTPDRAYVRPAWAASLARRRILPFWADFHWMGGRIDRVELAYVDEGKGVIPVPMESMWVTDYEAAVALLVHRLTGCRGGEHPWSYLGRLGITIVRDESRLGSAPGLPARQN